MSKRAIAHLSSDPVMSALIERIGIIQLRSRRLPPFQSLAHAIIHQQLNSNAAGTILERFKGLFPDEEFPTAGQVAKATVDRLRTAGLSRPKAAYIIDLAKRCAAGLIPSVNDCDSLDDEEIVARLWMNCEKCLSPNTPFPLPRRLFRCSPLPNCATNWKSWFRPAWFYRWTPARILAFSVRPWIGLSAIAFKPVGSLANAQIGLNGRLRFAPPMGRFPRRL